MPDEDTDSLSEEGYAAQLRILGLKPSGTNTGRTTIYFSRERELIPVPNPEWQTPRQRKETIDRLKRRMGVGVFPNQDLH